MHNRAVMIIIISQSSGMVIVTFSIALMANGSLAISRGIIMTFYVMHLNQSSFEYAVVICYVYDFKAI